MGPQAARMGKVVKCWNKIRAFWLARDRPSNNRNRERGFKSMPERSDRLSIRWLPNRLELDHFEGDNAKRHLRKGYVWYLVQDGQRAPEISQYFHSDHLPITIRSVPGGFRFDEFWFFWQSYPQLELIWNSSKKQNIATMFLLLMPSFRRYPTAGIQCFLRGLFEGNLLIKCSHLWKIVCVDRGKRRLFR